ncbi:PH domain-containing protein [Pleionea sp. CnH1-48]|uniref:PH domain-containing protein n=1 Tax=Pleionea sp. CnH1-48 TaxID=2954494 RepID=UPI0020974B45|nr:PH domain-containing protein [Pleionea sp. CnH1-48]MCO7225677.1 PH domain-containing protein [Pleionea sp. CnH1-48]
MLFQDSSMLSLADNAKTYFRILASITFGILVLGLIVAAIILLLVNQIWPDLWIVLAALAAMALWGYLQIVYLPSRRYETTRWRFDEQGMHIVRGIFWRKQHAVPRSRVQHIDVAQGPLQRQYGISTLVIHTAGTLDASVSLVGLSFETAVEIRDDLLQQEVADGV